MITKEQHAKVKIFTPEIIRPFFRWVGGKQNLINNLIQNVPNDIYQRRYFEPFLGAASLFLALSPQQAILSDSNEQLINTFEVVKKWPKEFYNLLEKHSRSISKRRYYAVREAFNAPMKENRILKAVQFVYLIQTSFNGIFRVNRQGKFNVPFGRSRPHFPSLQQILAISERLKLADLRCDTYEKILIDVKKDDFVYLDPPYPPLNGTSSFSHYTASRFSSDDQRKLAILSQSLSKKGALVLISNAEIPEIRHLYRGWKIKKVEATRYVSCKAKRKKVTELLIKNY